MSKFVRSGLAAIIASLGLSWAVAQTPTYAQQPPVAAQAPATTSAPSQDPCAASAGGRGAGRGGAAGRGAAAGQPAAPRKKRVLAWADSRNGRAQHEYVSYALAQLQRAGRVSGDYDVIIRTDSDIISFTPKMTDGKTPASGGPSLCNIDAIIFAGHRQVTLDEQQKKDLVSAIKDRGIGFVTLFIGLLPNDDFPEMANILGAKAAAVDVHDPWSGATTFINESPDSPFTRHFPKEWTENATPYHPEFYDRKEIQVLLRKDLSTLAPNAKYTRPDGDYPVAWIKTYGKGKVFYSSLGNNSAVWDNQDLVTMYHEAIKWSLGMTQYDVKPHPLPAGVRGPQGGR